MSETALIAIVLIAFFAGGLAGMILTAVMVQSGRLADSEEDEVRRMIEEGRA